MKDIAERLIVLLRITKRKTTLEESAMILGVSVQDLCAVCTNLEFLWSDKHNRYLIGRQEVETHTPSNE